MTIARVVDVNSASRRFTTSFARRFLQGLPDLYIARLRTQRS
jgi:hypothetical protein